MRKKPATPPGGLAHSTRMAIIIHCDRCEAKTRDTGAAPKFALVVIDIGAHAGSPGWQTNVDLCPECARALKAWLTEPLPRAAPA